MVIGCGPGGGCAGDLEGGEDGGSVRTREASNETCGTHDAVGGREAAARRAGCT